MKKEYIFFIVVLSSFLSFSQVVLEANGKANTYEFINSVLAPNYNVIETPDCAHAGFGDHIKQEWDRELKKNVFVFYAHLNEDNDKCEKFDRQRTEIKTYKQSPDNLIGVKGETVLYKWKFKLDKDFLPSKRFTHIHQIKAVGGTESAMPTITISLRKSSTNKLQIQHATDFNQEEVASKELSVFLGTWIQAEEKITYGELGTARYEITLSNFANGEKLLSYKSNTLRMWKTDALFLRPKWGIYRSIKDKESLRDEKVKFADFSIQEITNN